LIEERIRALDAEISELQAALADPEVRTPPNVYACLRTTHERDRLQTLLADARSLEVATPSDPTLVEIGDSVMIRLADGREESYVITHPLEAALDEGRISVESPLGRALLNRDVGDTIDVAVPSGSYECTIMRAVPG
jgi:transcription elongation GreA/GreB family factor